MNYLKVLLPFVVVLSIFQAQAQFLQVGDDDYVPVISTSGSYDQMYGLVRQGDEFKALSRGSNDKDPLTWSSIEDTDDESELNSLAKDTENPDPLAWYS